MDFTLQNRITLKVIYILKIANYYGKSSLFKKHIFDDFRSTYAKMLVVISDNFTVYSIHKGRSDKKAIRPTLLPKTYNLKMQLRLSFNLLSLGAELFYKYMA